MSKTVPFQIIQFCTSTQDRTLSGATTPGQSRPGSDGNEGVLHISQSSCISGMSPSDCIVSYSGHSLREFYPSAEKQSVYSTAPANRAIIHIESSMLQKLNLDNVLDQSFERLTKKMFK